MIKVQTNVSKDNEDNSKVCNADDNLEETFRSNPKVTSDVNENTQVVTIGEMKEHVFSLQSFLDKERRENASLRNQIDLLNDEISRCEKNIKNSHDTCRKLKAENDNLRRQLSSKKDVGNLQNKVVNCNENPEIDLCKAKLLSLQSYMNGISKSIAPALSESDSASVNPDERKKSIPIKNGEKDIEIKGQQISVIVTDRSRSYATVLEKHTTEDNSWNISDKHQQTLPTTPEKSTYVIVTSLIRGLGNQLRQIGTQATCYTYPGCLIPDIRGRIPHVLSNDSMPDRIVLQCGGNNAEQYDSELVLVEFKNLITDIKQMCPDSNIILSSIPHRKIISR